MTSAASYWRVSDDLAAADAVVVLGGDAGRPYEAARLYRSGLARRVLLDEDVMRAVVLSLGIPPQAVAMFGSGLKNTHEEACAVAEWAKKNKYRRIVVPTEIFPSRRVRWVFTHELKGLGVQVLIDTYPMAEYTGENWWLHQAGSDQFKTEFVKYLFYRARYSFVRC